MFFVKLPYEMKTNVLCLVCFLGSRLKLVGYTANFPLDQAA